MIHSQQDVKGRGAGTSHDHLVVSAQFHFKALGEELAACEGWVRQLIERVADQISEGFVTLQNCAVRFHCLCVCM